MTTPDILRHRLEIDFRLAGAGDAVEQRDAVTALIDGGAQAIGRRQLAERELGLREIRIRRLHQFFRRQHQSFQRAFVDQPVDDAGADAGLARGVALRAHEAVFEQRQHARARRGHALRRGAGAAHADALTPGPEMLAHAQGHAQHHAARRQRVAGDPVDELAQLGFQRRHVELVVDVFQPVVQARIRVGIVGPDHAQRVARAERHRHHVAGLEIEARRHPIGIDLIERHRHQDIDNAHIHKVRLLMR